MWTLVLYYLCGECDHPHCKVCESLPDRRLITILKAMSMCSLRDPRIVPQSPVYEVVPPNHAHAARVRELTPDQVITWSREESDSLDEAIRDAKAEGDWHEADRDDEESLDSLGITWLDESHHRGMLEFKTDWKRCTVTVDFTTRGA